MHLNIGLLKECESEVMMVRKKIVTWKLGSVLVYRNDSEVMAVVQKINRTHTEVRFVTHTSLYHSVLLYKNNEIETHWVVV